jgi:hypothetical protein
MRAREVARIQNAFREARMAAKKKSSRRRYSRAAGKTVESAMRRRKHGTLERGKEGHGGKVTSRKQAIAIGLSEAREKGEKVPRKRTSKKSSSKRASSKRSTSKRTSAKRSSAKRSTSKRSTSKRSTSKRSSSSSGKRAAKKK